MIAMFHRGFGVIAAGLLAVGVVGCVEGDPVIQDGGGWDANPYRPPEYNTNCGDGGCSEAGVVPNYDGGVIEVDAGPPPPPCNEVTFSYVSDTATTVWVTGDFLTPVGGTSWPTTPAQGALELEPDADDPTLWTVTTLIEPATGTYQYKFIVDTDTWVFDEENPERIDDSYGGYNSLISICSSAPIDNTIGDFEYEVVKTDDGFEITITYGGDATIDLAASETRLNGASVDLSEFYDAATQTFSIVQSGLTPNKYSYLLRLVTTGGDALDPLFFPIWVGDDYRYAGFSWTDGIIYQIFTDRFNNGDASNDIDNSVGDLARVDDPASQWQGGDFAGITAKIRDGYFESMGINALWISSPILNSHNSQPAVDTADTRRFSSYHSYHPIATGHTHLDDYGYGSAVESAFGTAAELHELVNTAHEHGIRVLPDFVANHVQIEANIYQTHPEWFFDYNACAGNWDAHRIDCWFTTDMPDFDYGGNPEAIEAVVDHAIWMVHEFNFDGFRADALKHMDDSFVRALRTAVSTRIETTVSDHGRPFEPASFYMVGESLGGWARYHVREDMVQGQVDEGYYNVTKSALLEFSSNLRTLADFAIPNDSAYRTVASTMGGLGGYYGAVMGNFFGNHDQWRALTVAGGETSSAYERLRMAQTFLFTSPYNVPMLYQGDDIGTLGGQDPDNRAFMEFSGLSSERQTSLHNAQCAGSARAASQALRRGERATVVVEDYFWVYSVSYTGADTAYVVLNRDTARSYTPPTGYTDVLGNCTGGNVPTNSSCIFLPDTLIAESAALAGCVP